MPGLENIAPRASPVPLSEIRRRRVAAGMTQGELARAAGLSQSHVAKIERGRVEPSYRNVTALLTVLEDRLAHAVKEVTAGRLATRNMVDLPSKALLIEAARMLRRHSISQLPVVDHGVVVGSLTDRRVVECIADPATAGRLDRLLVREVMEEPFPQLDASTSGRVAAELLRHVPAVLVTERGRPIGILTQSDLFKGI
ncbi:MAG: CBS domain-containing protein [Thermoplasmata archaeon]|nr:CBS domain-containing protein [Thermoplasmata archaeon]